MKDYDEWMTRLADPLLHRQYAQEWIKCSAKNTREDYIQSYRVPDRYPITSILTCEPS